jgi:predicted nucleic acid-binding protein
MACADAADPAHRAAASARDAWLAQGGLLVTTNYIADETLRPSSS